MDVEWCMAETATLGEVLDDRQKILRLGKTLSVLDLKEGFSSGQGNVRKRNKVHTWIKPVDIEAWLLKQYAHTMHQPERKLFPRNPYTVNNVINVWECDLVDFQVFAIFQDNYRYLITVIDLFSKFRNIVQLTWKTDTAAASALRWIFKDLKYCKILRRSTMWVYTDKCKDFWISHFRTCWKMKAFIFRHVEIQTWKRDCRKESPHSKRQTVKIFHL